MRTQSTAHRLAAHAEFPDGLDMPAARAPFPHSAAAPFPIRRPDLAIVQRPRVTVAVPDPEGPDGPAERTVNCALVHITRTELLNGAARKRP